MEAPGGLALGQGRRVVAARRPGEPVEPRPDRGQRADKSARPQQLAASAPTRGQVAIQLLRVERVAALQPIGRLLVQRTGPEILAQHPGADFLAATEQAAAVVSGHGLGLGLILMRVGHDRSPPRAFLFPYGIHNSANHQGGPHNLPPRPGSAPGGGEG